MPERLLSASVGAAGVPSRPALSGRFLPVQKTDTTMIIELKKNGNDGGAAGALDQIRRKQYFDSLTHYQGNLLFVGIDYDEKEKTHTCRMERFYKDQ